jgi:hypothetical protein
MIAGELRHSNASTHKVDEAAIGQPGVGEPLVWRQPRSCARGTENELRCAREQASGTWQQALARSRQSQVAAVAGSRQWWEQAHGESEL